MQMWFIQIIFSVVDEVDKIAVEIHMQRNVCVMCCIIVHQRHKQTKNINKAEQEKQENINAIREKGIFQAA
jgi:hypothetical protein